MNKPVLTVMAAGAGTRYGGLKQLDPVTDQGETILDFSLYDALLAGFDDAVLIVRHETEEAMRAHFDAGAGRHLSIRYAFQDAADLPPGYCLPQGRDKPWGTGHAVLAARDLLTDANFAIINADDFYGAQAFQLSYEALQHAEDGDVYDYSMVGFRLANTLTDHGYVSRGVCATEPDGRLARVTERLRVQRQDGAIVYYEDGAVAGELDEDATVSMNFWGFTPSFMRALADGFPAFLDDALARDPMQAEYQLPTAVDALIRAGRARVRVLRSGERWYGVTYREDKPAVMDAMQAMKDKGDYPEKLW